MAFSCREPVRFGAHSFEEKVPGPKAGHLPGLFSCIATPGTTVRSRD